MVVYKGTLWDRVMLMNHKLWQEVILDFVCNWEKVVGDSILVYFGITLMGRTRFRGLKSFRKLLVVVAQIKIEIFDGVNFYFN